MIALPFRKGPVRSRGRPAASRSSSAAGHKHAPGGLHERIFLGLELLWIVVAAAHLIGAGPSAAGRAVTPDDARACS